MTKAPPCLHCGRKSRLAWGKEIYPRLKRLWVDPFWKCDNCNAYCGCHKGTNVPLGFPANRDTRRARSLLHDKRLDPLWRGQPKEHRKPARNAVYAHLSKAMNLAPQNTHTGMFTIEQCREAWRALKDFNFNPAEN
jgi:hypothetical protein